MVLELQGIARYFSAADVWCEEPGSSGFMPSYCQVARAGLCFAPGGGGGERGGVVLPWHVYLLISLASSAHIEACFIKTLGRAN
jgi:hypothetical protein